MATEGGAPGRASIGKQLLVIGFYVLSAMVAIICSYFGAAALILSFVPDIVPSSAITAAALIMGAGVAYLLFVVGRFQTFSKQVESGRIPRSMLLALPIIVVVEVTIDLMYRWVTH
jgi:hypothetical protein